MTDQARSPARTDAEIQQAVWTCLATMLPTDQTQVESNALGLTSALANWTTNDLLRLVGTLSALAAHFYRQLEANHSKHPAGDE